MLKPVHNGYALTENYVYKDIAVPKGYVTDGISYKFRFVGILINKYDHRYIKAAIVHDWLTDLGDWDKANQYFEELLPETLTAKVMVKAVKIYKKVKGY